DRMKYEIASEVGVNLKEGYNGDITAREAGKVGGTMVKRLIEQAERTMSGR
ncbi:MAG: small, acid-soluble spore protein alpha/beta type, partial [Clostridia bacterium]|nr:small, acid-soluble spore protein alpha/beta type [Clostridia bacterium]